MIDNDKMRRLENKLKKVNISFEVGEYVIERMKECKLKTLTFGLKHKGYTMELDLKIVGCLKLDIEEDLK